MRVRQTVIDKAGEQAINMMSVNHVQSHVCLVSVLADARLRLPNESNRMLTTADLTVSRVIVNKRFLNVEYRTFNYFF